MSTPEGKLTRKISKYLKDLGPDCCYWRNVGQAKQRGGIPDYTITYRGVTFHLEAKAGKNKPTVRQQQTIDKINRAGGKACVVRSVKEVKDILDTVE